MQLRSTFRPTQAMIDENENVQFRRSRLSGGLYVLKLQLRSQWANNLTAGGIDGTPKVAVRDWNRAMKEAGIPRNRSMDARTSLIERKMVELEGDCYVRPV
jgi:hypothetical protein